MSTPRLVYAYAHGFLTGPASRKGVLFESFLKKRGLTLHLLNLNGGDDPTKVTCQTAMKAIDDLWDTEEKKGPLKLVLFGSSMGGYVSSLYAHHHPERICRLVLFCPAFDLPGMMRNNFPNSKYDDWDKKGYRDFWPLVEGAPTPRVPYAFLESWEGQPLYPPFTCPCIAFQGVEDDVVPPSKIKEFIKQNKPDMLVHFVKDDHALMRPTTLALLRREAARWLGLQEADELEAKDADLALAEA